jgi:predicted transglutaminase-like cysteine proteinase
MLPIVSEKKKITGVSAFRTSFFRSVGSTLTSHKLGALLVASGLATEAELDRALTIQKETGEPLGKVLVREGVVSAVQLYRKLAEQWCLKAAAAGVAMMVMAPGAAHAGQKDDLKPQFQMAAAAVNPAAWRPEVKTAHGAEHYPSLFGTQEVRSDDISAFRKWTGVMAKFEEQMHTASASSPRVMMWKAELKSLEGMSEREQVTAVNDYVNQSRYIEDGENYGKSDYWATPIEFFSRGGDCEDFAIAKYASLRALGFSSDRLRIVIVQDTWKNVAHAILAVYTNGGVVILDNQNKRVETAADVDRYQPIFSINSTSWWLHKHAES